MTDRYSNIKTGTEISKESLDNDFSEGVVKYASSVGTQECQNAIIHSNIFHPLRIYSLCFQQVLQM